MLTPTRSVGSRSGVNWTRFHEQSIDAASALARLVLPTPGTSSIKQVALGEQGHDGELDRVALAAYDAGDVAHNAVEERGEAGGRCCGVRHSTEG